MSKSRVKLYLIFTGLLYVAGAVLSIVFGVQKIAHLTIYMLTLNLALVFFTTGLPRSKRYWFILGAVGLAGFMAEAIGTNTGRLFGNYRYLDNLGPKIFMTPLLIIGLWAFVSWFGLAAAKASKLSKGQGLIAGAFAVTVYDMWLEPFAIRSRLWVWNGGGPGFFNYLCWFILAVVFISILWESRLRMKNQFVIWWVAGMQLTYFIVIYFIAVLKI